MPNMRDIIHRRAEDKEQRDRQREADKAERFENVHRSEKATRARNLLDRFAKAIDPEANRKRLADALDGLESRIRGDGRSRTRGFFGNLVKGLQNKLRNDQSEVAKVVDERIKRPEQTAHRTSDELRTAIESIERIAETNMRDIGQNLRDGVITSEQFRERMQREIRQSHALASMLGQGGVARITQNTIDMQDRLTSEQMRYLDRFTRDIEKRIRDGRTLDGIPHRASTYNRSIRPVAIEAQRQRIVDDEGETQIQERRVLNATAEHCLKCEEYARRGWQPVGELPKIGTQSPCGSNCRCVFEYRKRR